MKYSDELPSSCSLQARPNVICFVQLYSIDKISTDILRRAVHLR